MLNSFRGKIAFSGVAILLIGIGLLIFTFVCAYGFLSESLSIIAAEDLVQTFGEALAPLIATCIRVMYLGVMGWIGSLITIRGVTIVTHMPPALAISQPSPAISAKPPTQLQTQKPKVEKIKAEKTKEEKPELVKEDKPKEETKPSEPQFVLVPPAEISQPIPTTQQNPAPQQKETENKNSSQQQPATS